MCDAGHNLFFVIEFLMQEIKDKLEKKDKHWDCSNLRHPFTVFLGKKCPFISLPDTTSISKIISASTSFQDISSFKNRFFSKSY